MVGVITNPIVFMTVLGIIANFIFKQKVPSYLDNILTVLGKKMNHVQFFVENCNSGFSSVSGVYSW